MQLNSSILLAILACGATQVAAGSLGVKVSYGNGEVKGDDEVNNWDPLGTVQINPDETEHVDVADKKANVYGITRMRPECQIETVCSNDFKRDPVTVDKYIPRGNGPKKYVGEVCGKDGYIKEISLSCEGGKKREEEQVRVIDAIGMALENIDAEKPEKRDRVIDAVEMAISNLNAEGPQKREKEEQVRVLDGIRMAISNLNAKKPEKREEEEQVRVLDGIGMAMSNLNAKKPPLPPKA